MDSAPGSSHTRNEEGTIWLGGIYLSVVSYDNINGFDAIAAMQQAGVVENHATQIHATQILVDLLRDAGCIPSFFLQDTSVGYSRGTGVAIVVDRYNRQVSYSTRVVVVAVLLSTTTTTVCGVCLRCIINAGNTTTVLQL